MPKNYAALPGIPRTVPGNESRQRPSEPKVLPLPPGAYQEDNIYHQNKASLHAQTARMRSSAIQIGLVLVLCLQVARVWCECVRPHVPNTGTPWGGFDYCTLRLAGLTRAIQSRNYLHSCTLRYCLKNRS